MTVALFLIPMTMLGIAMLTFMRLGWKREASWCCFWILLDGIAVAMGAK